MNTRHIRSATDPALLIGAGAYALAACIIFFATIIIADFVVPDHDWIADTISDLGAGRYEFIVDIGLYSFAAGFFGLAVASANMHPGSKGWSAGIIALILLGMLVFLIGARNEYGDNDNEGVVIHIYLVYGLGLLIALAPFLMAGGVAQTAPLAARVMRITGFVWIICAPIFFFLPTEVDGAYERFLGLISFVFVGNLAWLVLQQGRRLG